MSIRSMKHKGRRGRQTKKRNKRTVKKRLMGKNKRTTRRGGNWGSTTQQIRVNSRGALDYIKNPFNKDKRINRFISELKQLKKDKSYTYFTYPTKFYKGAIESYKEKKYLEAIGKFAGLSAIYAVGSPGLPIAFLYNGFAIIYNNNTRKGLQRQYNLGYIEKYRELSNDEKNHEIIFHDSENNNNIEAEKNNILKIIERFIFFIKNYAKILEGNIKDIEIENIKENIENIEYSKEKIIFENIAGNKNMIDFIREIKFKYYDELVTNRRYLESKMKEIDAAKWDDVKEIVSIPLEIIENYENLLRERLMKIAGLYEKNLQNTNGEELLETYSDNSIFQGENQNRLHRVSKPEIVTDTTEEEKKEEEEEFGIEGKEEEEA